MGPPGDAGNVGMTRSRAGRLAAALALLPLCVWLAGLFSASRLDEPGPAEARASLDATADEVAQAFRRVRDEAERLAVLARDRGIPDARQAVRRSALGPRVDGVGLLEGDGRLQEWTGTPEAPPAGAGSRIGVEGLRTRLTVRSAPDKGGRSGTATLLLDGDTRGLAFVALLPDGRARATVQEVHFQETVPLQTEPVFQPGPPHVLVAPLEDGQGHAVGWVRLQDVRAAHLAAERRAQGLAAAAVLAALLAGAAALRRPPRTWRGLALFLAALAAGRALLVGAQACSHLLPRDLGSPSLFGTTAAFGAFASPADLALTCLAWWLAARALAGVGRVGSVAAAVLSVGGLAALSVSLGENARLDLLRLSPIADLVPRALLLAGWVLALQASAELCVLALRLPQPERTGPGAPRVATLLASLPLAALSTSLLLQTESRNEVERLRSEFAPQVLEQRTRREGALLAAVSEAASSPRALAALSEAPADEDPYVAYRLWVGGTLFRQGLQSSLDLFREDGTLVSHFGFDLPSLHEPPPRALEAEPVAVREGDPWALGFRQALLHAELPVTRGGVRLGAVVVHVTDDPSNLAFLPSIAPYLAALGPGHLSGGRGEPGGAPDYVLYDAAGGILLQTLDDPPPVSGAMQQAAATHATLPLTVGDEPWTALPLRDPVYRGRLHLLLMPARSALDYLGAFVRLALASLLFLALRVVFGYGLRGARWAAAWRTLRGSFYRKLLATLLLASVLPLVGLSLFLWTYIGARGRAALTEDATRLVRVVQKVIEDYASSADGRDPAADGGPVLDDVILHWLGRMVGQEILVYREGSLLATSKRELFSSGLLTPRLPGEVADALTRRHVPYLVRTLALGNTPIPVVYTAVRLGGTGRTVVAVPLVLQEQEAARAVEQVVEMLLLATVGLGTLLAAAVSPLARNVARPVRLLLDATGRIAAGDYGARLSTGSRDELAGLVNGFNAMSAALAAQRADLERRRDYMEALLRHATTGVLSTDAAGRLVTVNPAALALLSGGAGPPRAGEVLAEAVAREPELQPLAAALARPSSTGEAVDVDLVREGRARRLRIVRVALPDPDGGPPGALLLLEDVTDLMRSNQLAAWAEMARAIAHEIKNPLTPIQLSTEHLERLLRDRGLFPSSEIESCLQTVIKQVRALRQIASEFSAYAKLPDLAPRPTDPAEFLREVVAPYRASHPPGVAIEEDYAPAGTAAVDARVLARAVVNLIENALQAMPQGGLLRVAVRRVDGEVLLSVSDTGPGLDPKVRARLFTPYFSTKSSGTGLGLAIVRRAVEAHGGRVEVASAPGTGTTFTIHLPAV